MLFNTPWANPSDSRLKPSAFQGADLAYTAFGNWTIEGADMFQFENRTSSEFTPQTLLTSYPAGNPGLGLEHHRSRRPRHKYRRLYVRPARLRFPAGFSANAYFYGVSDIVSMRGSTASTRSPDSRFAPFIALQGGTESNNGQSYIGKIDSQNFGVAARR